MGNWKWKWEGCHLPAGEVGRGEVGGENGNLELENVNLPAGEVGGEQFGENVNLEQDFAESCIMSRWRGRLGNSGEILGGSQPGEHVDLGRDAGKMVLG